MEQDRASSVLVHHAELAGNTFGQLSRHCRSYRGDDDAIAAKVGGACVIKGATRVLFWGAIAMIATAGVGALVGAPV